MKNITLNSDQTKLIDSLMEFWDSDEQFFLLSGQAGVGKTTCMKEFTSRLKRKHGNMKICLSAPTNKATAVLKSTTSDKSIVYKTIYSVLGLRMMANGGIKELKDAGRDSVANFRLVVIDEGSMISSILLDYMESKIVLSDTKIVIIADREQLPPVGEIDSPIWKKYPVNYELTEVMRHQNSILNFVQSIRKNPDPKFISTGSQVSIEDDVSFMSKIEEMAKLGKFHNGEAKAIAWRNMTVDFLNAFIRGHYRKTISEDKFTEGDRVIFREPVFEGDIPLASTDQEGIVKSVSVTYSSKHPTLKVWRLGIELDDDKSNITANIIHEDSLSHYQMLLDGYSSEKKWYLFWKLKESFHSVTHGYALTAHRSQGSTFSQVFVEAGDIILNRNVEERTKCLYVACSRASTHLSIYA